MGEVHRADDLKLGQPVALKFLPIGSRARFYAKSTYQYRGVDLLARRKAATKFWKLIEAARLQLLAFGAQPLHIIAEVPGSTREPDFFAKRKEVMDKDSIRRMEWQRYNDFRIRMENRNIGDFRKEQRERTIPPPCNSEAVGYLHSTLKLSN